MRDVKPMRRGERLATTIERGGVDIARRLRLLRRRYWPRGLDMDPDAVRDQAEPLAKARTKRQALRLKVMDVMYKHCAELVRGACGQETVSADWVRVVAMELKCDILAAVGVPSAR